MTGRGWLLLTVAALAGLPACRSSQDRPAPWQPRSLAPGPNPFGPEDPQWAPQPHRDKPLEVVASADGRRAWVSLQGTPDAPGHAIAVVDLEQLEPAGRIQVGSSPTGLALHPDGRWLVVLNRFSNFASIVDTGTGQVAGEIPADPYSIEATFSPDGQTLWITNRWRDTVAVWDVHAGDVGLAVTERLEPGIPVGTNPRDIAMSADGRTVAVAALTGTTLSLLDGETRAEAHRVQVGAPVNGVVIVGDLVIVATLSASTHHLPLAGPDTDGDGHPGDGTPNVNFQDLQNELAVYDRLTGAALQRFTSDTICCKDYRDVDPTDVERHGDLLPPKEDWIVGGALPEQLVAWQDGDTTRLWVGYSASDELQSFAVDMGTGRLTPGPVVPTAGHNPHGLTVAGDRLLVVHRLSESLGVYDLKTGALEADIPIGDLSAGPFPSTDAEIGELFNFVTAPFSVDGDLSCTHCHREGGNIAKAFSMPLTRAGGLGLRMTMAYRGAADTRPWFFEAAMDQTNFRPVINEFARIENFCCSDYTLWPDGSPPGCATAPPPECATAPNTGSLDGFGAARGAVSESLLHPRPTPYANRDAFYLAAAQRIIGRTESFGDGLFYEDPISGQRAPVPLDFDGITRSLGLFLLQSPGLLPNPNDPESPRAKRGRALFESASTACATCHPAPSFALSTTVNPQGLPLLMGPVVSPVRADDGTNLDLLADGFLQTFPSATQDTCEEICGAEACAKNPGVCDALRDVRLGVPGLRGIWDRANMLLHDGRARSLREAVVTPGHAALHAGERGHNETDGIPDTHGGTGHLSAQDLEDLVTYMLTL